MSLLPFLWPKGEPRLRVLLIVAAACLFASKCFNVLVPIAMKAAVDDVSAGRVPAFPVLCYGLFRFLTDSTREGRDCALAMTPLGVRTSGSFSGSASKPG